MEYNQHFEIIGTIAFAVSGTLVGISKKMDIFGLIVLGLATAIGGGIIRDLLIGNVPPYSLRNGFFISLSIASTVILFLIYYYRLSHKIRISWLRPTYLLADNLGLAAFTVTGATVGFNVFPHNGIIVVILGLLTAVGGGIIRDILSQRIPTVLIEDIYALPSFIGAIIFYLSATYLNDPQLNIATTACFLSVFIIRLISLYNNWNLPRLDLDRNP